NIPLSRHLQCLLFIYHDSFHNKIIKQILITWKKKVGNQAFQNGFWITLNV
ncbi:hypothetical protein L9F63_028178, partial [Diploptera punctata]